MPEAGDHRDIERQVVCVGCGYDLRGIADDRLCPECGTPIARSNLGDRLAAADSVWLRKVVIGQTISSIGLTTCLWAIMIALVAPLVMLVCVAFEVASSLDWAFALGHAIAAAVLLVGLIGCAVGSVLITILDPRSTLIEAPLSARRIARWGTLILIAVVSLLFLSRLVWPTAHPLAVRIGETVIVTATVTIAVCASLQHLAELLARTAQEQLERDTRQLERRMRYLIPLIVVASSAPMLLGAQSQLRSVASCFSLLLIIVLISSATQLSTVMKGAKREFRDCLRQSRALPRTS